MSRTNYYYSDEPNELPDESNELSDQPNELSDEPNELSDEPNELPDELNELPNELSESEGNELNESREHGLEPEELIPSPTLLTNANMVVSQGRDWFCNTVKAFVLERLR